MRTDLRPFAYIICSAALFGASVPVAKVLVSGISPTALAGLLYLGAFVGLALVRLIPHRAETGKLRKKDLPYLIGSIALGGVAAPILLMTGISTVTGVASSLLLNLEGVATAMFAWLAFGESVGRRVWTALALMSLAGVLLTFDGGMGGSSLVGAAMIVLAMICWGLDNNLTRKIASTGPQRIAMLKGLVAGSTSLSLAFLLGQGPSMSTEVIAALVLGALSYGLSLVLFIMSLNALGSARTAAFFALGPFIGAALAIPLLGEDPRLALLPAAALMAVGAYLLLTERHTHLHWHPRVEHEHPHVHDPQHLHGHAGPISEPHSHIHAHEEQLHEHEHAPDGEHHGH
jgi:drug/metabolite transporter (DMT)-like permease